MSLLSTERFIDWFWFYKAQALIDMAECTVTCVSIIMSVNLACHEYGLIAKRKNSFKISLLIAAFADKDNP